MDIFENAIFKQREEINDRMTKIFRLLKELTTSRAPEKVLIREEAKFPVTKNVNSISLTTREEERSKKTGVTTDDDIEKPTKIETKMAFKEAEKEDEAESEPNRIASKKEATEAPSSQPVKYYLKHRINEKLIEGNDSLSGARVRKLKGKTYNLSPRGPVYEAILRKKITRKEDIGGNFEIPCNIGGLKHMNALVDQGSDVNVMPLSTYMKLTDQRPTETVIRLSLASHSYMYPLGMAEDILVEGDDGEVMFIDLIRKNDDSKEGEHEEEGSTTTKGVGAEYFDIFPTRSELVYHKQLDPRENSNRGVSNFIGRIMEMHVFIGNFTYIVNFMIVEDISSIIDPGLSQVVVGKPFVEISNMTHDPPKEKEHTKSVNPRNKEDKRRGVKYVMSKILGFYKECLELEPGYVTGMDDEGEVTLYLTRRTLEVLRKFHWIILGGRFNQLSHVPSPLLSKPGEY
ncbi:hypothetical protein Tco_0490414 [Tanacetum coccineum]